jgi:nitrate reductase (NAD(P)H)
MLGMVKQKIGIPTCRHPLNCEPPLPMLMEKGFITPVSLHYVRNHGAVPKLDWESHRFQVGGMVERPASFSVPELIALLPSYTIPVTLVCAGAPCCCLLIDHPCSMPCYRG